MEKPKEKPKWLWPALGGLLAGLANGFFGGSGGLALVPILTGPCRMDGQHAFPTALVVILPLCAVSAGIYLYRGQLDLLAALPYLMGGLVGGLMGGGLFSKISVPLLRRIFALFILYGGVRALL